MSEPNKDFKGMVVGPRGGADDGGSSQITGRLVFGLIVVALGILWTLDNLDILESEQVVRWWPALVLLAGVSRLTGIGSSRQPVAGAVLSIVGLLLLGNELDVINVRLWELWPIALIGVGAMLVIRSIRGPGAVPAGAEGSDRHNQVHTFAMWAGSTLKNESQDFRGGDLSAVMGGVELDLRGARTTTPQVVLDVFAWWGGVDIRVPPEWRVVSEVLPLMAGYEDKSKAAEGEPATTLLIRGIVIMGGIEVKN
ncbi:MAG: DUF5668 domain-containing protein [Candidatus Eisenbacteria bacterium]